MSGTTSEAINIEKFFLNTLLKVSILGVFLVFVANVVLFPEDVLNVYISLIILITCVLTHAIRNRYPTAAVLLLTTVVMVAMVYQRLKAPQTTTTISVILILGFIYSVLLKRNLMWAMHVVALIILNTIFVIEVKGAVTAAITYSTLYFILTYATWVLKANYDKMNKSLIATNRELHEKTIEIAAQNQELLQTHDDLNVLNSDLEKIVNERTAKIRLQNQILMKYSYANAHHLRGPVARLLGLASIYRLEPTPDPDFIISKMVEQAYEIDSVIKQINTDLERAPQDSLA